MFQEIRDIIERGEKFLITAHIDPDGDATGSTFSLYWVLDSLGKQPCIYLRDPVPYMYEFLPKPPRVAHGEIPEDRYDAVFALDCGNLFRVGNGYEKLKDMGPVINIDHHTTNEPFGIVNIIDANASSVAEILYRLYKTMQVTMTYDMAINIYTAIFTDTGSFRYSNTNSQAFLICEEMTRCGVAPSYVAQMVHENHPKERFLLLGLVLATLETLKNDTIAMAMVTQEMFRRTNTSKEHTEGFVESVREIRGVDVAILLREITGSLYKISMRSKGNTDVAGICNLFGGGGHRNAAGCTIDGTIGEVKDRLKEAFKIE
ncbi:MAG: bifunctional oligoribonuclease/PAP phosphatase NrnA [Syntrophorhabdus aromaticivorans]|uniref:Bifunctional oligoribonuclease/PAP phosphatase NrnA n=1 Tax=Syntrophorhabdus aromaticivorans TaxID=328301 RepID=A0A351U197_9BACT|nr:bifunctional oligoribonuclease/PAP phosphatase NrnA [Syntrophorhabdus aromaticivorans]HBA53728.1 DHH family phosphoesterase [Syntrophorhabdus aromaticivorans]